MKYNFCKQIFVSYMIRLVVANLTCFFLIGKHSKEKDLMDLMYSRMWVVSKISLYMSSGVDRRRA